MKRDGGEGRGVEGILFHVDETRCPY